MEPGHLHGLVPALSTVCYQAILYLLLQTRSLKFIHVGLAYTAIEYPVLERGEVLLHGLHHVGKTLERLSLGMEYHPNGPNAFGSHNGDD